jgi:hypothetical protein
MALGGKPNDPRRLSISRHVSPTSMSKLTEPFETKVTLPLLPLPKTEICRAIGCLRRQYTEEAPPRGSPAFAKLDPLGLPAYAVVRREFRPLRRGRAEVRQGYALRERRRTARSSPL